MKILLAICILFAPISLCFAQPSPSTISFDAALVVENDVQIMTRLTGIIDRIYVERGAWVKKGQPLAELDNRDLKLEMKKADVQHQELKAEYERAKSLHEQKLLSDSEYDARRLSYERSSAEVELAKVNYEKSIIRAPFSGVVGDRFVKIGQRVIEDENVALFRITEMEPLLARIYVPEGKLGIFVKGARSEFIPSTQPGKRYAARVKWISSTIDPASGTAPALIELNRIQEKTALRPGTSGKIVIWLNVTKASVSNR
jgi:membrane fusion protein, multidrug efflux system